MRKKYDFEYIIVGSGPAGLSTALNLTKTKKRIAIVESKFLGGSNINTRDIPYAVALNFSNLYHQADTCPELRNQDLTFSYPTIVAHQLKAIVDSGNQTKSALAKAGIVHLNGTAHFIDAHTIAVNEQKFTSEYFILATGSTLKISEIAGTDSVKYLTPETAIKVRRTPRAVLVVGGGPTGCEIATYFAELGAKVIIMETAERLLPREDKEVGELVSDHLTKSLGAMVLPNCKVIALEQDSDSKRVIFRNARTEKLVRVDCVVLATGSEPILEYGLENAGVKYKNTGITVDKNFHTSTKNIYAVGDCLGGDSSTERAEYEGSLLAHNLVNHAKNLPNYSGFTRIINTHPEIAVVGLTEDDLLKRDRKYKKAVVHLNEIPASTIFGQHYGFIKLLADKNNHLIGACLVAPHAELMIGQLAFVIRHGLSIAELAGTPQIANAYCQLIKLATKKLLDKK